MAISPKKSADACLFCFTGVAASSKLALGYEIQLQSGVACPWGAAGAGADPLKVNGDLNEKNRLVSNGAGNGIGFGSCGGYAGQGRESATAGAVRALGSR